MGSPAAGHAGLGRVSPWRVLSVAVLGRHGTLFESRQLSATLLPTQQATAQPYQLPLSVSDACSFIYVLKRMRLLFSRNLSVFTLVSRFQSFNEIFNFFQS